MRKQYTILDSNNFATITQWYEEGSQPFNAVDLLPGNFIKPKYNNGVFIEGATIAEIEAIMTPRYTNQINEIYGRLMVRALSSSMNKSSTNLAYLNSQREEYQNKYDLARGVLVDNYLRDSLIKEMNRDFLEPYLDSVLTNYGITPTGSHLGKMYQLVIFRFEYSLNEYNQLKAFIVDVRTKCITMLDNKEYSRLDSVMELANNIPESLTISEAENLYITFNAI